MNHERISELSERLDNLKEDFNVKRGAIAQLQSESVAITKAIIDIRVKIQDELRCEECES